MKFPIEKIRLDFPILSNKINDMFLVYLDSAASSQKPKVVIDSQDQFYRKKYSSVHRGIYTLSNLVTNEIENVRSQIAKFINANSSKEIIFTKGTTEGINLIANSWGRNFLHDGDNIVITEMEHHSNIIPWKMLAKEKKIDLRYIPLLSNGELDISNLSLFINEKTKLFSISHISNVLGTINPIETIISKVRNLSNATILIDGAQGIAHKKIDVKKLNCDFYVFSGHKIYGPTGIGILYGKESLLDNMPPWEVGSAMIRYVNLNNNKIIFNDLPGKFEAGSPNTAGIIGIGAAINYVSKIGLEKIQEYENHLIQYALYHLKKITNITIYGPKNRSGIISFNFSNIHSYDIGVLLDQYGISIRTGHHCAIPVMNFFKVSSMCRVSLAIYNNHSDIDRLISSLLRIQKILDQV